MRVLIIPILLMPLIAGASQMTLEDLHGICSNESEVPQAQCHFYILGAIEGFGVNPATCVKEGITADVMQLTVKMKMGEDLSVYPKDKSMPAVSFVSAVAKKYFSCKTINSK